MIIIMSWRFASAGAARAAAVLGVTLGVAVAMAAPAQAQLSNYTIINLTGNVVEPYSIRGISVPCPSGSTAISGGETNSAIATVVLHATHVSDGNGSGWHTAVRNLSGQRHTFNAYAVCAAVPSYQLIANSDTVIGPFRSAFDVQTCTLAGNPMGGGLFVDYPHADSFYINSSYPLGPNWAAEVDNDTAEPVRLYTYVACGGGIANYQVVSSPAQMPLEPHQFTGYTVECPAGTVVLGGGAHAAGDRAIITDSYPSNTQRWDVFVYNRSSEQDSYTAYAVCGS